MRRTVLLLASAFLVGLLACSVAFAATFVGTGNADTINRTAERDDIWGCYGDDLIQGLDGDDSLRPGGNSDTVRGGRGNDQIRGDGGAAPNPPSTATATHISAQPTTPYTVTLVMTPFKVTLASTRFMGATGTTRWQWRDRTLTRASLFPHPSGAVRAMTAFTVPTQREFCLVRMVQTSYGDAASQTSRSPPAPHTTAAVEETVSTL